jgi:hypothetical protein
MDSQPQQPQNALSVALSEINSSIFEIGDVIPNGIYLEMMNNSKKIFDEVNKLEKKIKNNINSVDDKVRYIRYTEDSLNKVSYIISGKDENNGYRRFINFYDMDDSVIMSSFEGNYIRLFESGGNYKFMRIDKINDNSIIYSVFRKEMYGTLYKHLNRKLIIKKGNHTTTMRARNILIYKSSNMLCEILYSSVMTIEAGAEGLEHNDALRIDIEN